MMVGATGCDNKKSERNEFIEKVKILETNEYKINNLEITYDEFKDNIKGIFSQKYEKNYLEKKASNQIIWANKKNYIKEIEGLSEEELENYQAKVLDDSKEDGFEKLELTIEISDATYEGTFDGEKRVYSKKTRTIYSTDMKTIKHFFFTMYDFKKINDEWKISNVKNSYLRLDKGIYDKKTQKMRELSTDEIKKLLASTAFTPENNNKIKYVESINFTLQPK